MVSLRAVAAGVGLSLTLGCPSSRPVLPELTPAGSGSSDGGSTASSLGSSSSGAPMLDSTTTHTSSSAEGSTGTEPACGLDDGACVPGAAPWWDPTWARRRRIDVVSPLTEPLVDGVIPVRLDAAFEYECARPDGVDLRFVDDDGMVMAHEIDEWNPGAGAVVWVRIPLLEPSGTSFWMYYENPEAEAETTEVWSQALGHQAVLHFAGDLDDALGLHHGEPAVAGEPLYVDDGMLGRAVHYERILVDARTELIGSDEIDDAIIASQSFTVTAWVRSIPDVASPGPYRAVVSRGSENWSLTVYDGAGGYDFLPPAHASFITRCQAAECAGLVDAYGSHFLVGDEPVIEHPVIAVWHHLAIVFESLGAGQYAKRLHVDGELDEEFIGPLPLPWNVMALHAESLSIGAGPLNSESSVFHGELDEVHIASQAWPEQRIRAEHAFATQADLVTVGAAECR